MGQAWIDFDAPDLAARIEQLDDAERDVLPFGVIRLDREGIVQFYNATEGTQSGNPNSPRGLNFYTASCMGTDAFRGRIERALEEEPVDLEIAWPRDYGGVNRELRIRVQSARDGGVWVCIERDRKPATSPPTPPCAA
jgi:photoactive yellow protein